MNGLSLCAGVGGLDLGVEIAFPDYRCIAAIENNPEAASRFRIRFPKAKVFENVVGFDARPLHGIVDCIVAGWPNDTSDPSARQTPATDSFRSRGGDMDTLTSATAGWEPSRLWGPPQTHDVHPGDASRIGRFGTEAGGRNLTDDVMVWEPEASSWMTPRTLTGGGESGQRKQELGRTESGGGDLQAQVENWPTPANRDYRDPNAHSYQDRDGLTKGEQLPNFVEHFWRSPGTRDWHPGRPREEAVENSRRQVTTADQAISWPSPPAQPLRYGLTFSQRVRILLPLCRQLRKRSPSPYRKAHSIFRRKLNPDFVDWLMGWPVGWSSADRAFSAEEMELYLSRQRWSLGFLLNELDWGT